MQTKIAETSISLESHPANIKRLFKIAGGLHKGKMIAIIQNSATEISYTWSDKPYASWSSPVALVNDANADPFDAVIDGDGNIYVIYCGTSNSSLISVKLTFAGGVWTSQEAVQVSSGSGCESPTVIIDSDGTLWASWSISGGEGNELHVKSSSDGGLIWGLGPMDAGETVAIEYTSICARMVSTDNDIHLVYATDGNTVNHCSRSHSTGEWSAIYCLATGSGIDGHLDAAVSPNGIVGIVVGGANLRLREYDGTGWRGIITVDPAEVLSPQLIYADEGACVSYLRPHADDQMWLMYSRQGEVGFSDPCVIKQAGACLDSVILHDSLSNTYVDLSSAAANDATGDLFHPASGRLVTETGDRIFAGMDQSFRVLRFVLSTPGIGGTVLYSYWNGTEWCGFVPEGGAFSLDSADQAVSLWPDLDSVPVDWQKCTVNGAMKYWIRIEVVSPFTTGPVGSQLTACSDLRHMTVRR